MKRRPAILADDARLARLLMESHVAAYAAERPARSVEDFAGVCRLGAVGYLLVARELIRRGVLPPAVEDRRARRTDDAPPPARPGELF